MSSLVVVLYMAVPVAISFIFGAVVGTGVSESLNDCLMSTCNMLCRKSFKAIAIATPLVLWFYLAAAHFLLLAGYGWAPMAIATSLIIGIVMNIWLSLDTNVRCIKGGGIDA